ncbi:DinB family protein [Natronosporangium hydrolyticum]|uniref:DinB family protein n=1 Tax=Natronosporangium hydrolyticum TaxID=2811111 RepID=A0A895YD29_9ACTN|nr:DinB family protein [Natronosporangium hydrolyticum]QSB13269.1 DinB family protein [Natronosporangium hydrolyticum]
MSDTEYDTKYTERHVLLGYLNVMRRAVIQTSEGLTEADLRRPGVASGTNLLGIIHHLTGVEQHWFQRVFLGEPVVADKSMTVPAELTRDEVVAAYRQMCDRSDEIVHATLDLGSRAAIPNPGEAQRDSLRVILVHLIEETARHAGHADILREQLDGVTAP